MTKLTIDDLELAGKKVLIRVDFNVPLKNGVVTDDTRIREALPTIRKVLAEGGLPILMSHAGRPKNGPDPQFSLKPAAGKLAELIGATVHMATDTVGPDVEALITSAEAGSVVLLENTRFYAGESKNDSELAAKIARLGDVYINDAFGSAHRAHSSTEGVTHFITQSAMGYLLKKEVEYLSKVLEAPERPFVAVIGGAKVSDKIGVIEALLPKVDHLLIGGGMTFTFLKAKSVAIGKSLCEDDKLELALALMEKAGEKLVLPDDHLSADAFASEAQTQISAPGVPDDWMGLDIGPDTIIKYQAILKSAKTVVWNGPMGVFEMPKFARGTIAVAEALAESTRNGGLTVVGGGDSVAAISQARLDDDVSHVSTGGGAMLEFLEGMVLPGVAALSEKA
ncbi:MAG: phosphoglycerate kinase [Bacteroidetes Order II. Incertae sedis bacterium]|nr:phosphoglycerate kinase [Bacteroidetes Order II. bacterium]